MIATMIPKVTLVIDNSNLRLFRPVPELPGCVASGASIADVESQSSDAVDLHGDPPRALLRHGCMIGVTGWRNPTDCREN